MNTQKEQQQNEQQLLNAFNECLKNIVDGMNIVKNKNDYLSELCLYALKLKKSFNRDDVFHTLLIKNHLYQLKAYFEHIGLFFTSKKENKTDIFLRVVVDVDGLFKTCSDIKSLITFKDFLKEQKENKQPPVVDYQKRLKTLFKNLKKEQVEQTLKDFLKGFKNV